MRRAGFSFIGFVVAALLMSGAGASAQEGPGGAINPERDCQTVRTCNFSKDGSYRGCLSSYTCRTCRFVEARCAVSGEGRTCRRIQCTWGG